ncbi:2TM domain-containing protein [Arundinibacter roseus]|uniref:2TM domain-containing protein n=1 Tax=Arundinibacter roseus TaxID=2070510 RepID=A0A4R4KLJ6_9BACT|nr:2TM domain-containing protein [Arundinibacter roseus]TDB67471.1 2TM domain-containing protein [Arundinibacter roseus]
MNIIIENQIIEKAKRRVGFKIHLTVFILLFPINWIIWAFTDTSYLWPVWPALGWGVGLLFHWLGVYHTDKFFSIDREVRILKNY